MNNQAPIVIDGLVKSFDDRTVLNGISLAVNQRETLAVLGRSGGGKSVLLKLIIGLQQPDSGSIQILGKRVDGLERTELNEVRKKIGFLFQQAALYDSLTVADNIAFPLDRHSKLSDAERGDRVRELLSTVGMEADAGKLPSQISGGMQKRVGLARALALDPEILLFDEPTAGLDPITSAEIEALILKLKNERGITAMVVTHDIRGAKGYSDRVVLLHDGNIAAQGSFDDLERSRDEFVSAFLRDHSQGES